MELFMKPEHMTKHELTPEMLTQFQAQLTADEKSSATIEKYLRDMECFMRFCGSKPVTKDTAIRYKEYLMQHYKPASVNSMLAALNHFFKEAGWHECIVKSLKIQRQTFRPQELELTKEEYYRLLHAAREKKDTRLCLLMETICSTGIRVSELCFITIEAAKSGKAFVSLKGKTRTVLLPGSLCKKLKSYARQRHIRRGAIFVTKNGKPMDRSNILHSMKSLCKAANVEPDKVFPHNLRHLFACLYYKAVHDISRLADLLGHSNINTTRIYTCVSGKEQIQQIENLNLVLKMDTT